MSQSKTTKFVIVACVVIMAIDISLTIFSPININYSKHITPISILALLGYVAYRSKQKRDSTEVLDIN